MTNTLLMYSQESNSRIWGLIQKIHVPGETDKFLGFYLTKKGIKVNPDK